MNPAINFNREYNYDRRNDRGDLVWNKDSEELRYKYLLMMTKV